MLRPDGTVPRVVLEDLTAGGCRFSCEAELPLSGAVTSAAPDNIAQMAYAVPFGPLAEKVASHTLEDAVLPLRARVAIILGLTGTL